MKLTKVYYLCEFLQGASKNVHVKKTWFIENWEVLFKLLLQTLTDILEFPTKYLPLTIRLINGMTLKMVENDCSSRSWKSLTRKEVWESKPGCVEIDWRTVNRTSTSN